MQPHPVRFPRYRPPAALKSQKRLD